MIVCLALIGAVLGGLLFLWFHDWETPQTMYMEERKDE